jgi:hypothetical protein
LFLFLSFSLFAQKNEKIKKINLPSDTLIPPSDSIKKHSPKKATLYSAIIPGLGQVYNRKYWKVPIIYLGMGAAAFFALNENNDFVRYKNAYVLRQNGEDDEFYTQSDQWILSNMEISRRNRDLMVIATTAVYVLNIVDAAVDAHLFYFDVSDDLAIQWQPVLYSTKGVSAGFSLSLKF